MNVIAIDFDRTASDYPEQVNKLFDDQMNFIIIHTARPGYLREITEQQLKEKDIKYHVLVMDKIRADLYIDDRNEGGLKWPK
jgi:uncharacterized HAD superfamily protein